MMNKETDIRKLLDKEIKKASHYFFPPEEQDNGLNKMKLVKTIVEEVNSRIKGKLSGFFVFHALLGLLDELSIEPIWANQIFTKIYSRLKSYQNKSQLDEEDADDYKIIIFELKLTAVSYFKKQIHRELKDNDLPKKLKLVKKTLIETNTSEDLFKREALTEIQKEIETEIVLKAEENKNKNLLKDSSNDENKISIHKDLTQITATLFLNYLLNFAKEKSRENHGLKNKKKLSDADKDRIIDFLTPISGKQSKKLHKKFKDEIAIIANNEKNEVSENFQKFYQDMQIIRKYFEMLGLSEITNKIDTDLGEI